MSIHLIYSIDLDNRQHSIVLDDLRVDVETDDCIMLRLDGTLPPAQEEDEAERPKLWLTTNDARELYAVLGTIVDNSDPCEALSERAHNGATKLFGEEA